MSRTGTLDGRNVRSRSVGRQMAAGNTTVGSGPWTTRLTSSASRRTSDGSLATRPSRPSSRPWTCAWETSTTCRSRVGSPPSRRAPCARRSWARPAGPPERPHGWTAVIERDEAGLPLRGEPQEQGQTLPIRQLSVIADRESRRSRRGLSSPTRRDQTCSGPPSTDNGMSFQVSGWSTDRADSGAAVNVRRPSPVPPTA